MLDRKLLSKRPEEIRSALARRGPAAAEEIDRILELEAEWKAVKHATDENKHALKEGGKGMKGLDPRGEDAQALRKRLSDLSAEVKGLEARQKELEGTRDAALMGLPNLPDPRTPEGATEADNLEVHRWGEPPSFDFPVRPHWEVGEGLGILDLERAARMSGARFAVLRGDGARLERALANLMLDIARGRG